jgi:hypothetical protein
MMTLGLSDASPMIWSSTILELKELGEGGLNGGGVSGMGTYSGLALPVTVGRIGG